MHTRTRTRTPTHARRRHTPPQPPPPPCTSPLIERNRCYAPRDSALLHGLDLGVSGLRNNTHIHTHTRAAATHAATTAAATHLAVDRAHPLLCVARSRVASRARTMREGSTNTHTHTHTSPPRTPPPPPPHTSPLIERNRCYAPRDRALLHGLDLGGGSTTTHTHTHTRRRKTRHHHRRRHHTPRIRSGAIVAMRSAIARCFAGSI